MKYPPLSVLQSWRDEGLSPVEICKRCESVALKRKPIKLCLKCDQPYYAKGFCKQHYYRARYRLKRQDSNYC